jgi:hypothetical protein
LFQNAGFKVGVEALVVVVNVAVYWLAFRVLTPAPVGSRELFPGAVLGGVGWTLLQGLGLYLVGHNLRHAGEVYGAFALVLGTLAWIYLGAELSLYAAEVNVVFKNRLWPRSIVQPPLTEADKEVLDRIAAEGERRPEQHVESYFDVDDKTLGNGGGGADPAGRRSDDPPRQPCPPQSSPAKLARARRCRAARQQPAQARLQSMMTPSGSKSRRSRVRWSLMVTERSLPLFGSQIT